MIKIEISSERIKHTVEREDINPETSLDDLINILFISGYDISDIEIAIISLADKLENKHKNDKETIQNSRSL